MNVRTRFAPSPTGDLHLGGIRAAVFAYLFAKHHGGTFILRIEDTDKKREKEGSALGIAQSLAWLGIPADEGVVLNETGDLTEIGEYGPYTQSARLDIYAEYVGHLLESGAAYRCFATAEELEEMKAEQARNHQPPRYDGRSRDLPKAESDARAAAGEPFVIRQRMPAGETIAWTDEVFGEISFSTDDLEDHVLLKSDGFPTYQLASVVDDHLMKISHVLRGQEWIPSTPKNLLLYKAFGWEAPVFAHMPVILGPDGKSKLSKREGAEPVLSYDEKGYLPEAILNFLAFLGWSPGTEEEFFGKPELAERFELGKVQKAPAVFNEERLKFVNGWYIRHLPVETVWERMRPHLQAEGVNLSVYDPAFLLRVAGAIQERMKFFGETVELSRFFFVRPTTDEAFRSLIVPKGLELPETLAILSECAELLGGQADWSVMALETLLRAHIERVGRKPIQVLWPIRAALTGVSASPGTFEMLSILGKDESLERIAAATAIN